MAFATTLDGSESFDPLVLAIGADPLPCASGRRPAQHGRAYFVFTTLRSGTTESAYAIFIPAHPLPLFDSRRFAGAREEG